MLNLQAEELRNHAIQFLEKNPQQRLQILKELGIARYEFLTKIRINEANIDCVMQFFQNPTQLKFPNLIGADLSDLVLNEVNFIRGNLSQANLRGSSLINADLLFVNLTKANLTNANLTGATLNKTVWVDALVEECNFGEGIGLTQLQRKDLQLRGARFNSSEDD